MKRLVTFATAALIAALVCQPAVAAQPTPASGETWAPNQRIHYRWKTGTEPPAWAKAAMNAAAADSNSSRKSNAAIFSHDQDGASWLAYTDELPTSWAIGYAVRNIPHSFTIRMRPHGTHLDWGTLRWCEFYDDPPNGCYDLEMVTLHEFGHAQTLGHVEEGGVDSYTDSVMHATGLHSKAKAGWNQHVYGRCDVARLQIRYEPLTTSTRISTCLNLGTDLSLSPLSSSVTYGSSVTFTARLKIDAGAIYPKLVARPLSGRSVILQRRLPGDTNWTTVGDLAPVTDDTGRYVKTVTLTGTYDWRAGYSATSDEGLRGTTSSISRLSMSYPCYSTADTGDVAPQYETC